MKRDHVIGLVGTLILVVAMLGVFRYESATEGGAEWIATWSTAKSAGPGADGRAGVGQTATKELAVEAPNVTRAEFALAWTDDIGDPDTFHIVVTSPDGVTREAEGATGSLLVAFDVLAGVPAELHVLAADQREAEARAAEGTTTTKAMGTWLVKVTLRAAPGLRAPVGGPEVQADGANAWTLTTSLTAYKLTVARA